jgi:hypothetical protein
MLRRVVFSLIPALLLGATHCVGEDCSSELYFSAFDLAAFCASSDACTPHGVGAADDSMGDDPEWFGAFGSSPLVIDLTALGDEVRTKPFLAFARYTTAGTVPDPTQIHFDADAPCVPLTDVVSDGQDYACIIPPGATTLTIAGGSTSETFEMYLFGFEPATRVTCAV